MENKKGKKKNGHGGGHKEEQSTTTNGDVGDTESFNPAPLPEAERRSVDFKNKVRGGEELPPGQEGR